MAVSNGGRRRSNSDLAMIGIVLLIVIAVIVWFIVGRRGGDDGIDIDIDVPAAPTTGTD